MIINKEYIISNLNVNIKDITINSGAELTINKDASLFLSGDFINNSGTVNLNSDSNEFSSLIIKGTSTGNIIYNRYVNSVGTDKWDLIGSPVDGLSISSFARGKLPAKSKVERVVQPLDSSGTGTKDI